MRKRLSWLNRALVELDKPFRFAGKLTVFALVLSFFGTAVSLYVQYAAWRDDQNLTRYRDELSQATTTLSDLSSTLSAMMNLQQLIYYTFVDTIDQESDADQYAFNAGNAKQLYDDYFGARTALRKTVDSLAVKAAIFIDVPIYGEDVQQSPVVPIKLGLSPQPYRPAPKSTSTFVVSDSGVLKANGFNCKQHMPRDRLEQVGQLSIDWSRVRDHVVTFYYCLDNLHYETFAARQWAKSGKISEPQKADFKKNMPAVQADIVRQTTRFNSLVAQMVSNIHQIRIREMPKGFFCHQIDLFCASVAPQLNRPSTTDVIVSIQR
jgi:hypothetical protein